MYPQQELTRLAAHKLALRSRIAARRIACCAAVAHLAQPVAWLDRLLALWRQLSPMAAVAAVPLGALAQRLLFPRHRLLGSLLRWGPLAYRAWRRLSSRPRA
jgi:hypothetical protein